MSVSFIIPCYNDHNFLDEAIESILQHTSGLFEILIIDDGSPNPIVTPFDKYPNVKVLRLPTNQGVSAARNMGIQSASGDYIVFCDSDDLIIDDVYTLVELAQDKYQSADLIFGLIGDENKDGPKKPLRSNVFSGGKSKRANLLSFSRFIYSRSFLISKGLQFTVGMKNCEDTLFIMRCAVSAAQIIRSNHIFYHYRTRQDSASNRLLSDQQLSDRFALLDGIIHLLKDLDRKAYYLKMLQTLRWDMYILYRAYLELNEENLDYYISNLCLRYQDCFALEGRLDFCVQNGLPWTDFHETCIDLLRQQDTQHLFSNLQQYFLKMEKG